MPRFSLKVPPAGPLRSTGITPLHRYYEPIRQALTFDALRLATRAPTLLREFSSRGQSPSLFPSMPLHTCRRPLPRQEMPPQIALDGHCCLRRMDDGSAPGFCYYEVSTGRSRFVAARVLARPAMRGFVGELHAFTCHPSYAASISYRFRTFTLWFHGFLQASRPYKRSRFLARRLAIRPTSSAAERATDGSLAFHAPDGRCVEDAPARCKLAHDPVLALVEANLALGIGARTCIPEWMGEKPDYDWITDALWRRDERGRSAVQGSA